MKTTLPYQQQTSSQTYIQSHAPSLSCHLPCEMLNAMPVRNLCSQGAYNSDNGNENESLLRK